jgi:hypothetical protein
MTPQRKVIHVELNEPYNNKHHWYFGSILAIYDTLPIEVVGIAHTSLWNVLSKNGKYTTKRGYRLQRFFGDGLCKPLRVCLHRPNGRKRLHGVYKQPQWTRWGTMGIRVLQDIWQSLKESGSNRREKRIPKTDRNLVITTKTY